MKTDRQSFGTSSGAAQERASAGFKVLVAVALIGLGLLYVVGDAVVHGSSSAAVSVQSAGASDYGD
jgi:hypothetical protein